MSDVTEISQTWAGVIANFFLKKRDSDEEKYIKNLIKEVESDCKINSHYNNELIRNYFLDDKLKKEKQEQSIDFQRRKIQALFTIKDALANPILDGAIAELRRDTYECEVKDIANKYDPAQWLAKSSKDAASVSFATHVSKLTHSKIDSPSIYDQVNAQKAEYVTTSSLSAKAIDGAVAGNQFAPIFQLLELVCNSIKLAAELSNPNSEALKSFSKKDEYLEWNKEFGKALVSGSPSSHLLAKQIFFPLNNQISSEAAQYHLLCILTSSSIAQAIFEGFFSDEVKINQKEFQEKKFSEFENRYFSTKAKIGVTASNHNNASQLNGRRGGKLYLFSSAPPTWQSQPNPPIYQTSFFDSKLHRHVLKDDVDYLRDFLIRFDKINISIKHPERKKWIEAWVGRIIDDVLAYSACIQNMEPGWSATEGIRLKRDHQLFLDPYREDDAFQAARKSSGWQSTVCADFARWLNKTLVGKEKQFSPQPEHTRMWIALIEEPLREYDELTQMDIKFAREKT